MSKQASNNEQGLTRIATGIPGLDEILHGGFYQGAVYILRGTPGAGKTILANQMCFHHASHGGRALFVTLLAENHARMLQHLEQLSFFDRQAIPKQIYYISAFRVLEENGLKGMMDLLRREMRAHEATLLILDGLIAVEETSASDREFRKFIHELQAHAVTADCCTLLLTTGSRGEYHPEHTMVDGLIALEDSAYGKRRQRELEVRKFRGSASLRGRHPFRITDKGLEVYPRPESRFHRNNGHDYEKKISWGIPQLDEMFGGGIVAATSTVVLGASGTGKTTLGTAFLAQSSKAEPGLHFGFYESPERLISNATELGFDLKSRVAAGHLEVVWTPPVERILDRVGNELIDAVMRRKVKRLFLDGWGALIALAETPDRLPSFVAAIFNELRALGVTTLCAVETDNLVGPEVRVPTAGMSAITENMVLLRFVEYRARLHRMISIMKVRGSSFDPALREFAISDCGIELAKNFESAEQILSGFGKDKPAKSAGGKGKGPRRTSKRQTRG
ncbi:MAG TPA: ATPase domain-containing protein [Steroidobacteraceae bacterium]|nr:ATPase domain-containing protein [Steroidobacteraceae bacterium]